MCTRTARVSTAGAPTRMWSNSSPCWRGRCRIRRSQPCSTGPARRPARATAGPVRAYASCAIIGAFPPYRVGERAERGELTLEEAAKILDVSEATVRRSIKEKALAAHQLCKGAPWVIRAGDLESEDLISSLAV